MTKMLEIHHDEASCRFSAEVDGHGLELDYVRHGEQLIFSHTGTAPELQGRGLAGKLVEHCIGTLVREADRFVGVNDNEVRHKKALNVIRDAGSAGITRTKLIEKTHFLGERRDAVFQALCESGQITIEIVKGRTKPTQLYRFVAPEQRQDEQITENPGGELSH